MLQNGDVRVGISEKTRLEGAPEGLPFKAIAAQQEKCRPLLRVGLCARRHPHVRSMVAATSLPVDTAPALPVGPPRCPLSHPTTAPNTSPFGALLCLDPRSSNHGLTAIWKRDVD